MKSYNLSEYLAKPDGTTLQDHIRILLDNLSLLKSLYAYKLERACPQPYRDYLWKALELACEYHDHGKMCSDFQEAMKNGKKPTIRHNCLSPIFLLEHLSNSNELSNAPKVLKNDLIFLICNAILYHHHRLSKVGEVEEVLQKDFGIESLSPIVEYQISNGEYGSMDEYFREGGEEAYMFYYLLKGILLRIDHASSAKIRVEKEPLKNISNIIAKSVKKLKPFQEQVFTNRDKNIILKAPAGSGKTEAGLLFLDSKGFFVLPVITSINAMYERLAGLFGKDKVGLLHSNAFSYLHSKSYDDNTLESIHEDVEYASNFAHPIIVCTPEQILPFVLRFKGFEKYYSVLSYSDLIIDEVHAYDPVAMAYIFKAVEHTVKLHGRVLVMSATIPSFLEDDFKRLGFELIEHKEESLKRHCIKLVDKPIEDAVDKIMELSRKGKVLIIVNTVGKAQKLYIALKEKGIKAYILHSRFINKTRRYKERLLKCLIDNSGRGVFITTQLTEVSMDISADYLITELSTIDSLIQRMGRVNRKAERGEPAEPNVLVYTHEPSGVGSVYHKELVKATLSNLMAFNDKFISEEDKNNLVNEVFSSVGYDYIEEYENTKIYVDKIWELNGYIEPIKRDKAIKNFRRIFNITVIPNVYEKRVSELIRDLKKQEGLNKLRLLMEIFDYSLSVPYYMYSRSKDRFRGIPELEKYNVHFLEANYERELGLVGLDSDEGDQSNNIL